MNVKDFESIHKLFEQRFNCPVCWGAKLRMVSGLCQHRLCEDCLYNQDGSLSAGFQRCPTCQQENVFPSSKPSIPEDNIEIQRLLGILACPNKGCGVEMWTWELEHHEGICPKKTLNRTPKKSPQVSSRTLRSSTRRSMNASVEDSPEVLTPSPTLRNHRQRPYPRQSKAEQNARRSARSRTSQLN